MVGRKKAKFHQSFDGQLERAKPSRWFLMNSIREISKIHQINYCVALFTVFVRICFRCAHTICAPNERNESVSMRVPVHKQTRLNSLGLAYLNTAASGRQTDRARAYGCGRECKRDDRHRVVGGVCIFLVFDFWRNQHGSMSSLARALRPSQLFLSDICA